MPGSQTTNTREKLLPWILFVLTAAIYLSFLTQNYYWDGIAFAQIIEDAPRLGPSLVHPNHLLYNLVGYVFYRTLQSLGFNLRAVTALQILNALLSAGACAVLFQILRHSLRSVYLAFTLSLLFAFTATWWKFSTDAAAYVLGVFLLLCCFYLALLRKRTHPLVLAIVFAAALCIHQMAIFFLPVLIVAIFIQDQARTRQRQLLDCLTFVFIAGGLTLAAYVFSFYLLTGSFHTANFLRWTVSYSHDDSFGFRPLINLGYTLRGHGRLLFGGRFNAISGLVNPAIVALVVLDVVLFIVLAYKVMRHFRFPDASWLRVLRTDSTRRKTALLALVWAGSYLIALYVYVAHHTFYRLFYLPSLIILIGLVFDSYAFVAPGSRKYRLAIFVAVVALTNFLTQTFPHSHAQKYPPLTFALELKQAWPRGTIVYYSRADSDNSLLKYINPGMDWRQLDLTKSNQIEQELLEAQAGGVSTWIETTAIVDLPRNPEGAAWLNQHVQPQTERAMITKGNYLKVVRIGPAK